MASTTAVASVRPRGRMTINISHRFELRTATAMYYAGAESTGSHRAQADLIDKTLRLGWDRRRLPLALLTTSEALHAQDRRHNLELLAARRNEDRQRCAFKQRGIQSTMGDPINHPIHRHCRPERFLAVPERQGLQVLSEMMRRKIRNPLAAIDLGEKIRACEKLRDMKAWVNVTLHVVYSLTAEKIMFEREADKLVRCLEENKKVILQLGSRAQAADWDWEAFRALFKFLQTRAEQGDLDDEWFKYLKCLKQFGVYLDLNLEDRESVSAKTISAYDFRRKTVDIMDETEDQTWGPDPFGRGLEEYEMARYNISIAPTSSRSSAVRPNICSSFNEPISTDNASPDGSPDSDKLPMNLYTQSSLVSFGLPSPSDFKPLGDLISILEDKRYQDLCEKEAQTLFSSLNNGRMPTLENLQYLGAGLSWISHNQNEPWLDAIQIMNGAAEWALGINQLRQKLFDPAWKTATGSQPLLGFRKDLRIITDILGVTTKGVKDAPQMSASIPVDSNASLADNVDTDVDMSPPISSNVKATTGQADIVPATTAGVSGGSGFSPGLLATSGRGFGGPSAFASMTAQLGANNSATMLDPSHATLNEVKNGTGLFASANIKNTSDLLAMFHNRQHSKLINQERQNVLRKIKNTESSVLPAEIAMIRRACEVVINRTGTTGYDWATVDVDEEIQELLNSFIELRDEIDDANFDENNVTSQPILNLAMVITKACTMIMHSEKDIRAGTNSFDPTKFENFGDIAQVLVENPQYDAIIQEEIAVLKNLIATNGVITSQHTVLLRRSCDYILTPAQQDWFDVAETRRVCRDWWNVMFQLGVDLHPHAGGNSEIDKLCQDILVVYHFFNPGSATSTPG